MFLAIIKEKTKEASLEVPRRGATPGVALKLNTPAHLLIGQAGFLLSEQCAIGLLLQTTGSLGSLLVFPSTGLIIKTPQPALLTGEETSSYASVPECR